MSGPARSAERAMKPAGRLSVMNFSAVARIFVCFSAGCLLAGGMDAARASFIDVPLKSLAQITVDDNNEPLDYPTAVFYDPIEDEIYLVNGSNGRIVVYGPDFFPRISIGNGRGVVSPRDGLVTDNGDVYVCQVKNFANPRRRITVLNPAFFVEREIFLDEIPEAEGFSARSLAVSSDGMIYLAGNNQRGILVLDSEGRFLRHLRPEGDVSAFVLNLEEEREKESKSAESAKAGGEEDPPPDGEQESKEPAEEGDEDVEAVPEDDQFANIPEEFRPQTREEKRKSRRGDIRAPVKINHVSIDESGKIYLISPEAGKIYVYGPDESLLFSFGTKGGSPGQMSNPRSLAIDEERELIYVADYMRHTILVFNKEGKHLFEVGGRGVKPTWFNYPTSVTLNDRGHLVVADLFNKRVQVLDVGYEDVFDVEGVGPSEEGAEEGETSALEKAAEELTGEKEEDSLVEEVIIRDEDISGHTDEETGKKPSDSSSVPADSGANP